MHYGTNGSEKKFQLDPLQYKCTRYHSTRVYLQIQQWIGKCSNLNPEEWGWCRVEDRLEPSQEAVEVQRTGEIMVKPVFGFSKNGYPQSKFNSTYYQPPLVIVQFLNPEVEQKYIALNRKPSKDPLYQVSSTHVTSAENKTKFDSDFRDIPFFQFSHYSHSHKTGLQYIKNSHLLQFGGKIGINFRILRESKEAPGNSTTPSPSTTAQSITEDPVQGKNPDPITGVVTSSNETTTEVLTAVNTTTQDINQTIPTVAQDGTTISSGNPTVVTTTNPTSPVLGNITDADAVPVNSTVATNTVSLNVTGAPNTVVTGAPNTVVTGAPNTISLNVTGAPNTVSLNVTGAPNTDSFNGTAAAGDTEILTKIFSVESPIIQSSNVHSFGGAFTDAAGINYKKLGDKKLQQHLIDSYFSPRGIQYNIGRIPMASCDFSTHQYSYDNFSGDFELNHFSLAPEDNMYKIPMIKAAQKAAKDQMVFFGSPWSAPGWMKTNGEMAAGGKLKGKPGGPYFKAWAQYFVRFIQEYNKQNIPIWGVTAQNEPTNLPFTTKFQQMSYTPEVMRDFIKIDLGPALNASKLSQVKLMILDDQRLFIPYWAKVILSDAEAKKYISGIAVHWYFDNYIPAEVLSDAHNKYPDIFILATEACQGSQPWDEKKVLLGSWTRAEEYAQDIISDLNHYAIGWIDWNLDLDLEGGPNWVNNFVDSPIIVNVTKGRAEFLKQPMFYALGHFSKFLPTGSVRVDSVIRINNVDGVAFETPDNHVVLILLNKNSDQVSISIDTDVNQQIPIAIKEMMPANSIQTYIWKIR
ncbi:Glucosylceramidase [Nymphon striatum]|nr:Glucosylceramidase [Nymphon striatum]